MIASENKRAPTLSIHGTAPCQPLFRRRSFLTRALMLWRERKALARLEDARLDDIGLTQDQARAESRRPVWDAPEFWHD